MATRMKNLQTDESLGGAVTSDPEIRCIGSGVLAGRSCSGAA
jgi:hypothetical protein